MQIWVYNVCEKKLLYFSLSESGYQVNSFLISGGKRMLCVLIRSTASASNEYPQHMFLSRNKKNIDTFLLKKVPYQELWGRPR